jgi:hypothetical protein
MNDKKKTFSLNFSFFTWKNGILLVIACFYLVLISSWIKEDNYYGSDFLGYWSAGKIATEKGYSNIYDSNALRTIQAEELYKLGIIKNTSDLSLLQTSGSPYLPFYNLPFQLFSKLDMITGYWLWVILNLVVLICYLIFFTRKLIPESSTAASGLNLVILMLLSFPVIHDLANGQVTVLLLICAGEFIRNAVKNKPVLSGVWLGVMLLKPQVLILIIPTIIILRNWKTLLGFLASSGVILAISFLLSGATGMITLFKLWTGFGASNSMLNPGSMINWRMVGENFNVLFNTSWGWVITGLGMALTILAVFFLIKQKPAFGSPQWVITMLGVFSASLSFFWHTHYYTALVMIPFLIYASIKKLLPEKIIFSWAAVTPFVWLCFGLIGTFLNSFMKTGILGYQGWVTSFSGFVLNLIILVSTLKFSNQQKLRPS